MNDRCDSCGKAWEDHDGIARTCQRLQEAKKRIAELEALLEKSEHGVCAETGARCRPWCIRCEWEKMKGGAE